MSSTNFAFGVPFFPKGAWRAACVEPQRKIESPFRVLELEGICARQGLPLEVTTSPPRGTRGPELAAAPHHGSPEALQTWEPSSDSSPC